MPNDKTLRLGGAWIGYTSDDDWAWGLSFHRRCTPVIETRCGFEKTYADALRAVSEALAQHMEEVTDAE